MHHAPPPSPAPPRSRALRQGQNQHSQTNTRVRARLLIAARPPAATRHAGACARAAANAIASAALPGGPTHPHRSRGAGQTGCRCSAAPPCPHLGTPACKRAGGRLTGGGPRGRGRQPLGGAPPRRAWAGWQGAWSIQLCSAAQCPPTFRTAPAATCAAWSSTRHTAAACSGPRRGGLQAAVAGMQGTAHAAHICVSFRMPAS